MAQIELRPTSRIVTLVAGIERQSGRWDRISQMASPEQFSEINFLQGVEAMLKLDSSCPGVKTSRYEQNLQALAVAHHVELQLTMDGIRELHAHVINLPSPGSESLALSAFRTNSAYFTSPALNDECEEVIYPTISSFLIEPRLTELLCWINSALSQKSLHPLLAIPAFHLIFLQIHPFQTANHRLGLLLLWHLLRQSDYDFVRYIHFAPYLAAKPRAYFAALRQAEKTAPHSWASLNVWLEFFLQAILQALDDLLELYEKKEQSMRLTSVQKQIVEVVKTHGTASRERISQHTGINLSTIKYNLSILSDRGHLKREGAGRTTSYRLV